VFAIARVDPLRLSAVLVDSAQQQKDRRDERQGQDQVFYGVLRGMGAAGVGERRSGAKA
jgi:hypothetical protein